ncbi:MAG TPA: nucleotidyltransferase family protein [Polyangiaceae bacterium]
MIPVAILAGGLATRLGAVTKKIPKSLVEIAGEPFVAHQLRGLHAQGIERVVLCIGHLGEQVEEFVGDGSAFGLEVAYSSDRDKLLGTGGALRRALPQLGERFFVLYGDSYLEGDFAAIDASHATSGKLGLMTVLENNDRWDRSNVLFEHGRILRYDKSETEGMHHIDWGLGVLDHAAFAQAPSAEAFDLPTLYRRLLQTDQLAGFEVDRRFYEIGSAQGIQETTEYLLSKRTAH